MHNNRDNKLIIVIDTVFLTVLCLVYGFAHNIFPDSIAFIVVSVTFVLDAMLFMVGMARAKYVKTSWCILIHPGSKFRLNSCDHYDAFWTILIFFEISFGGNLLSLRDSYDRWVRTFICCMYDMEI